MESDTPVALITGSSRGVGRAIALELAAAGFDIVVNYVANRDAAENTARGVAERDRRAIVVEADVSSPEPRRQLVSATRDAFGRIDALVNNAAVAPRRRADLLEMAPDSYAEILATNLEGPFFLTQEVARWMVEIRQREPGRRLSIVNISSLSEYTASVDRGEYCIAKAGLAMLTELFAVRLAPDNILVNSVRPGIIATDMTAAAREKYDRLIADGLTPLRRWGQPEDVARVVRALVRGDFDFSTGAVFDVDGGFHLKSL
ncbi:MAG: 3-ketoacyl-ACP reductase [Planctomycetota bacterium]|nr:3-ketoacyl-ACP reductase [Planctomycetota bacterium]